MHGRRKGLRMPHTATINIQDRAILGIDIGCLGWSYYSPR